MILVGFYIIAPSNCALQERIAHYKKYQKGISVNAQQKQLTEIKELFPEYRNIHSQVLQSTLRGAHLGETLHGMTAGGMPKRADCSYQGFFRRWITGEKAGYPRFKNKDRFYSVLYPQSWFAIGKPYGLKNNKKIKLKLSKVGNNLWSP